jgi:hypothetical protein
MVEVAIQKHDAAECPTVSAPRVRVKVAAGGTRALRMGSIARPEIPYDKVARVLLDIAKRMTKEEEADEEAA